ncbi:Mediator-associated protein 3 [Cardamine amara subsp. amara]|uniref:Mediator-associated protein 3 n=1 Tax=Cardamine amara subsp. amara TaxID=228776 RepID=A0ABD1BZZ4_CARAN
MEEVAREEVEIDKDVEEKIKKTVKKILQGSSFYKMTENKAREQASSELDLDLSQDPYKLIVKEAVGSYVEEALKVVGNKIVKLQTYNTVDE